MANNNPYATDQNGMLPESELGLWFDKEGWVWMDTQDGTTNPFRTFYHTEPEEWRTLAEAIAADLQPLGISR
jgi:hypothetical protein